MRILEGVNIDQLIKFIFRRHKKNGGFATFPSLPSTIEDTFYAIDIIVNLNYLDNSINFISRINTEKIVNFIKIHEKTKCYLPIRLRYYLHKISEYVLGENFTNEEKFNHKKVINYEDAYYITQFMPLTDRGKYRIPRVDLGDCTCKDIHYYVLLFSKSDAFQFNNIVNWLRNCQNGDGGFGFYPGTTSFIENCNYCISTLSLLGEMPSNIEKAERFILSCQTGAGGFSRNIKATAFLESSWHAINALKMLNELRKTPN